MTRTESAVRDLLGSADPLDRTYGQGPEFHARAEVALEWILLDRSSMRAAAPARKSTVTVRRVAIATGVAVAAGAVVVTTLPGGGSSPAPLVASTPMAPAASPAPSYWTGSAIVARPVAITYEPVENETAAEALRRIAASARESTDDWEPPSKEKPYTYTHLRGWWGETTGEETVLRPTDSKTWLREDGTGRSLRGPGEPIFADDAEHEEWLADGSPQGRKETIRFEADDPASIDFIGKMATTAAGLDRDLRRQAPVWDAREKIMTIGDVYRSQVPEPATRAALLEMLADTPGVKFEGKAVDRAGRTGLAFSGKNFARNGCIETVVFDEKTGVLLYAEATIADLSLGGDGNEDFEIGDVAQYDLYLGFGRVATDTEVPETPTDS